MKPAKNETSEYWDLYHADGRFEKVIPSRGYDIPADMYHMTIEVIPTDKAGHMLVTQRSFAKRLGPGKLEFPAGSVLSGEQPYVAARRELLEETGLKAASVQKLGSYILPRIQRTVYVAHIPDLLNAEIRLQEDETIGYAIVTFQQWMEYIAQERFETSKFRHYTPAMFNRLEAAVGIPEKREDTHQSEKTLHKLVTDIFAPFRIDCPIPEEEELEIPSLEALLLEQEDDVIA